MSTLLGGAERNWEDVVEVANGSTSGGISRRSVAKGAAWATPTLIVAAPAPALAASPPLCTPTVRFSGSSQVDFGNASQPNSNQQIAFGGQVYVDNLPKGVTVTGVTEQWFIEQSSSNTSNGDGFWFMGSGTPRTNWNTLASCTKAGCSVSWTGPLGNVSTKDYTTAPGNGVKPTGWSSKVTNTQEGKLTAFPDGKSRSAWDATLTWGTTAGSGLSDAGNCRNFTTGPSGKFGVNYYNAPRKAVTAVANNNGVHYFTKVTITLSVGGPLTYTTVTGYTANLETPKP